MIRRILHALFAGALGGTANSLAVWLFGVLGITPALGFQMAPRLTASWLVPRLVVSAVWGLLFLLPFWNGREFRKGAVLSLLPATFMLLVVFPKKLDAGLFGLQLGPGAPYFVILFTLLWGITAAAWFKLVAARR